MKQLALQHTLSLLFGYPRFGNRYDVFQWDEVQDAGIGQRVDRVLVEFRRVAQVDGEWPGIWFSVARDSVSEFERQFPEDTEADIAAYRDEDFPEELWIRVNAHEDEREQVISLYPFGVSVLFRTSERIAVVPSPWNDERRAGLIELLDWLTRRISDEVTNAVAEPETYQKWIEENLPRSERLGWFRRRDLWSIAPNTEHLIKDELTDEQRATFAESTAFDRPKPLEELTANDYFRFVEICYRGAGYEGLEGLTARRKYERLSDGRHDGLLDIDADSSEALEKWMKLGSGGGHPWEIARGGNRTHISLFLRKDAEGYRLSLAGSAQTRAAETIRMALALCRAGVSVELHDFPLHRRRVLGEDLIAIVPSYYLGAYPHTIRALFPEDIEVHDHMSHELLAEHPVLVQAVHWVPCPRILVAG